MMELIRKEKIHMLEGAGDGLRAGVVGRAGNPVDYTADFGSIRAQEKSFLGKLTGIGTGNILFLNQTHGDDIVCVDEYPAHDNHCHADADAIVTPLTGVCAVIRTADCVPLILFDRTTNVLAAVHSGWKGSSLGIAGKAATLMIERYGCRPENIAAAILPSIGPRSYEVKDDVARFFPCDVRIESGKIFLDLWKSVADSLVAAKVMPGNIFNARVCTLIGNDEFFSHRKGDIQRNLNFAYRS